MLMRFMNEFLAIMPTQMPELLPTDTMEDAAIYDDYAQLVFHPTKRLTIEQVLDIFDEQAHLVQLYHRVVSEGLKGWQCCCAFSNPCFRRMYKFNAIAGDDGTVDTVTVFIFESIEVMRAALRYELAEHRKAGGMIYEIPDTELIAMFF